MSAVDPTPSAAPTPVPAVDVPEPQAVAEAGVTTSEWKVVIGYALQLAVTLTSAEAAKLGLHLSDATINLAAQAEVGLTVVAAVYIIGRSLRKKGTTA